MTKGLAGISRRLVPAVLVLTLCGVSGAGSAESPLPVVLEEVAGGQAPETRLEIQDLAEIVERASRR